MNPPSPDPTRTDRSAARLLVSGGVQGVGYRWFARDAAQALGLSGWVRNLRDGTVEAEVQGSRERVEDFARHLRRGPPAASVTGLTLQWLPVADAGPEAGRSSGFDIRPTG